MDKRPVERGEKRARDLTAPDRGVDNEYKSKEQKKVLSWQ